MIKAGDVCTYDPQYYYECDVIALVLKRDADQYEDRVMVLVLHANPDNFTEVEVGDIAYPMRRILKPL